MEKLANLVENFDKNWILFFLYLYRFTIPRQLGIVYPKSINKLDVEAVVITQFIMFGHFKIQI